MPKRKVYNLNSSQKRKGSYDATTLKILKTPHVFDSNLCAGIPQHELEDTLKFYKECCRRKE